MSLIEFNKNRFSWNNNLVDFFDFDTSFNADFFNMEKSLPAMNVKEHENDFEITMNDDILEVSTEKSKEEEDYNFKEFNYRSSTRLL